MCDSYTNREARELLPYAHEAVEGHTEVCFASGRWGRAGLIFNL